MQDSLEGEEQGVRHQVAGEGRGLGLVLRQAGQVTQLGVPRHGALGEHRVSVTQSYDDNTHCEPLVFPVGRLENLEPGRLHQRGDCVVRDRVDDLNQ